MDRTLRRRTVVAAALAVAIAAVGCGDVTEPGPPTGNLSLEYTGDENGHFSVAAGPPAFSVEGVPEFEDWALAAEEDSLGGAVVAGFLVEGEESGDLFVLQLVTLRTGEFSCAPGAECHGRIFFGIPDHGGLPNQPAEEHFEIVAGEVDVTAAGEDRITGTVSFTARSQGGTGPRTLAVEDGTFDLFLSDAEAAGSVLCMGDRASGSGCS